MVRSTHPWVNQFLGDHLRSVRELIASSSHSVSKVDVVILAGKEETPVESYGLEFDRVSSASLLDRPDALSRVELTFRSMLLKLNGAMASLAKLDVAGDDVSFTLRLHVDSETATAAEDLRWAAVDKEEESEDICMIPVYAMREPFRMKMSIRKC